MALVSRATVPQEFIDVQSARLLVQPEPMYLHGKLLKMALGASFGGVEGSLGLDIPGRTFGAGGVAYQTDVEAGRLALSDGLYSEAVHFVSELGARPGQTVRINRPSFANTTYTQASREVPSGTVISTTPIAMSSEQTSITIRRFAGPYSTAQSAVAPMGIDRFDAGFMIHSPADMVGLQLKRDFDKTLDTFGVKLFDQATTIVRPAGFNADNDHFVANDGPMTWRMLQSMERQLDDLSIPYFGNGKRVAVLATRQVEQLTLDPTYQRLVRTSQSAPNPAFAGTFVGEVGNWAIFKSITLTTVASTSGDLPTVYYGQAFGPGAVGAGAGDMPSVAYSTADNFGLTALLIWLFNAGFEVLDTRFIGRFATS